MLIDPLFRHCVSFAFIDVPNEESGTVERRPAATVFYVGFPAADAIYAVTARHVVEKARPYGSLYIRVNQQAGGYEDLATDLDDWVCHPAADVAVTRFAHTTSMATKALSIELLATNEYVSQHGLIEGDKVFFIGLFNRVPGFEQTQPIVRFGNISLMPHEPIPIEMFPGTDTKTRVHAYLVESRSWGGESGAPAFVYYADTDRLPVVVVRRSEPPKLLGLVHGHYEIDADVVSLGYAFEGATVSVNAGIAVVIPSQYIIDLLMSDELVAARGATV